MSKNHAPKPKQLNIVQVKPDPKEMIIGMYKDLQALLRQIELTKNGMAVVAATQGWTIDEANAIIGEAFFVQQSSPAEK